MLTTLAHKGPAYTSDVHKNSFQIKYYYIAAAAFSFCAALTFSLNR